MVQINLIGLPEIPIDLSTWSFHAAERWIKLGVNLYILLCPL
jgi:hypothetical protein